jgi:hypothetical protein
MSMGVPRPRTHAFRKQVDQVTKGFSVGPEVEMNNYSNGKQRDTSATVDLAAAMELRTRYNGNDHDM